jgi:hypothetical protein
MPFRQPATGIQRCNPVNLILLVGSPVIVKKKMGGRGPHRTGIRYDEMGCSESPTARAASSAAFSFIAFYRSHRFPPLNQPPSHVILARR